MFRFQFAFENFLFGRRGGAPGLDNSLLVALILSVIVATLAAAGVLVDGKILSVFTKM